MKFSISILLFFLGSLATGASLDLENILKKVDDIRNPAETYFMKVTVSNQDPAEEAAIFDVMIGGPSKTLITTIYPPGSAGKKYLMLGEDMWAYTPNLGRPVRASLNQRLSGQTANGDISRMRWSGDYAPTLESDDENYWVLFLTAKKKNLTYDKLRVWIKKKNYFPMKAEFLTLQSRPLKYATYQDYKTLAGKIRPTKILIQDAKIATDKSVIRIKSMIPRTFPLAVFNQNSLK